jgi:hypothetical protein
LLLCIISFLQQGLSLIYMAAVIVSAESKNYNPAYR